ncbi:MAG: 4-hydroxythreonine-4-phosphate dehydrogenase PdxA [Methylacidiphilales bacterium]|nr:4-hydroxythreonine-4-phosphate dehydrogenase PdxA [Candidatus Methylacidiphilales bacterium]
MGEPMGIGPQLCLSLASFKNNQPADICVLGSMHILKQWNEVLGLNIPIQPWKADIKKAAGVLYVENLAGLETISITPGKPQLNTAPWQHSLLTKSAQLMKDKTFNVLVNAPIDKFVVHSYDPTFKGHTEWYGSYFDCDTVMLLEDDQLRIALTTTHIPLSHVANSITIDSIYRTLTILHTSMQHLYGLANPRIIVCGLNPHAGEFGLLGTEEQNIIIPAITSARDNGILVQGPYSADSIFQNKYLSRSDVVLTMYHDQGLPVLKSRSFGLIANVTLGLPIIRTSVDHGTAYDLASRLELANPESLHYAIRKAIRLNTNY